ncbi:MAG: GC-type dockerin domain-anchored protein, partial [Phycisphaerales bacterium JB064]
GSQVIQFQSGNDGHLAAAMGTAGITPDIIVDDDFPGLTAALNDPAYGVALISNPCCFFDAGTPAALDDFIGRGNVAHLSFWNMDAEPVLQGAFGVATAVDFFTPRSVFNNASHPSWGAAASPVNPAIDPSPWNDNGDSMTAAAGATVVGTFDSTSGDGAIIVANGDATLFNGFDYDSMEDGQIRDLLAAQLGWLPSPGGGCRVDLDMDGSLTIFDFLAFQNLFDMGDLQADFDGDGVLTIFDFLTFQNEFDMGCE